jgi:hypothetical protein
MIVSMKRVSDVLAEVEGLIASVKPGDAEERLRSLIAAMERSDLEEWEDELRQTINRFLPKRRRSLTAILDARLTSTTRVAAPVSATSTHGVGADPVPLIGAFASELDELRDHHIFQWPLYSDLLSEYLDALLQTDAGENDELRGNRGVPRTGAQRPSRVSARSSPATRSSTCVAASKSTGGSARG